MDIEIIEDMYVAKLFAVEGARLKVGQPIALLCDNESDICAAQETEVSSHVNTRY